MPSFSSLNPSSLSNGRVTRETALACGLVQVLPPIQGDFCFIHHGTGKLLAVYKSWVPHLRKLQAEGTGVASSQLACVCFSWVRAVVVFAGSRLKTTPHSSSVHSKVETLRVSQSRMVEELQKALIEQAIVSRARCSTTNAWDRKIK